METPAKKQLDISRKSLVGWRISRGAERRFGTFGAVGVRPGRNSSSEHRSVRAAPRFGRGLGRFSALRSAVKEGTAKVGRLREFKPRARMRPQVA